MAILFFLTAASFNTIHLSGITMIPQYVDEYLYTAFTIQGFGIATGTMAFPFITQMLLDLR